MKKLLLFAISLGVFVICHGQNLLTNGNFESGIGTNWNNLAGDGGVATYSLETANVQQGTNALRVVITTLGSNGWSIQSIHSGWTATSGAQYKLSFYARAAANGTQINAVQQNTTYAAQTFTLTTAWTLYEWTFTAGEASLQHKFQYSQTGTVWLDNVQITAVAAAGNTDQTLLNPNTYYQKVEGFGGALAFYENWYTAHPNKEAMYNLVFRGLGLDWLRIRNNYRYQTTFTHEAVEFVQKAQQYRGDSIKILMCSWSPPATLKSNNNVNNGTLKKVNNEFVYGPFGTYWKDALLAYRALGVYPDVISLQNEPDWLTDGWETNKLKPLETADTPSYSRTFDSTYKKVSTLTNPPKMIGPEMLGIGYGNFNNYSQHVSNRAGLWGYAYHLYHGGDPNNPDSYNTSLNVIKNQYNNKPNYMTEYEHFSAGWLKSAWLINQVMTQANASNYIYWDLIWPESGLIDIDNPWNQGEWENANGYTIHPHYYAVKHYSKHIENGYHRISCTSSNSGLRTSAYLSKDGTKVVIVYINTSTSQQITSSIVLQNYTYSSAYGFQSVDNNYYQNLTITGGQAVLPASSVTTVILSLSTPVNTDCNGTPGGSATLDNCGKCVGGTTGETGCLVLGTDAFAAPTYEVYPNPYDESFRIADETCDYEITDLSGQVIEKGHYVYPQEIGQSLNPGMYVLVVTKNGIRTSQKIIKK